MDSCQAGNAVLETTWITCIVNHEAPQLRMTTYDDDMGGCGRVCVNDNTTVDEVSAVRDAVKNGLGQGLAAGKDLTRTRGDEDQD